MSGADRNPKGNESMSSAFVLVHGAWQGAWAWEPLRRELAGQRVFTPTLTGLGERSHLADPVPGLATHVEDVVRMIEWEELDRVVLVGHSYAGMVITAVADRLKPRIRRLVYLDAAVPGDGDDFASAVPGLTPDLREQRRAAFRSLSPDGQWLPPVPAEALGVTDPAQKAWLERRSTPHPLRSWLEPVRLPNGGHAGLPKTYVLATQPMTERMGYPLHAEVAKRGGEWSCREVACGHQVAALRPAETARILLEAD